MKQEVTKRLPVKRSVHKEMNCRCSVIATLRLFATKWKPCILCYLWAGPMRYSGLYRIIPNISRKVLSEHLKELDKDGLILRVPHDPKLQKVEYALTEKGRSLMPILETLQDWGLEHLKEVAPIREMLDLTK